MPDGDWIKIYRKMKDSKVWYYTDSQFRVWMTILLSANWKEEWGRFNGEERKIKPGEYPTSITRLADESGVSKNIVRTTLNKLERDEMVTCKSTQSGTLITVLNWGEHQKNGNPGDTPDHTRGDTRGDMQGDMQTDTQTDMQGDTQGEPTKELEEHKELEEKDLSKESDDSGDEFSPGKMMALLRSHIPDDVNDEITKAIEDALGQIVFSDLGDSIKRWIIQEHKHGLIQEMVKASNKTEVFQYKNQFLNSTVIPDWQESGEWKDEENEKNQVDEMIDAVIDNGSDTTHISDEMNRQELTKELKNRFD